MKRYFTQTVCLLLLITSCNSPSTVSPPSIPEPAPPESPPSLPNPSPVDRQTAEKLRLEGLKLRQQGNYERAIQSLEKAVNLDPTNLSGQIILGWTLHLNHQETQATIILNKALEQEPNSLEVLNALGIVYLVSGNLEQAVTTHQKAVSLDNQNEIAQYNLSLAFQRLQKFDLALQYAQQATTLEPLNPHPWISLALIYWSKNEKEKSKQTYRQAIALDARYQQLNFLSELKLAGFNDEQIKIVSQILKSL
jgi:Flp pilus assembly protein TadD